MIASARCFSIYLHPRAGCNSNRILVVVVCLVLLSAPSCELQRTNAPQKIIERGPSLHTLVRGAAGGVSRGVPSLRTLVRVATANMHKMFGARTDYYVRLNLIECEGRPSGPGSSIPTISTLGREVAPKYWREAVIQNMFASASHSLAVV